jgi:hypothetical protein
MLLVRFQPLALVNDQDRRPDIQTSRVGGKDAIHPVAGPRLAGNGAFDSSIASWLMWCVTTAATVRFLEGILL